MFDVVFREERKRKSRLSVKGDRCAIGSARQNDLVLKHKHVSNHHAVLYRKSDGVYLDDLGSITGTWINRERVMTFGPLSYQDEISNSQSAGAGSSSV